jgi:hypothetical protein
MLKLALSKTTRSLAGRSRLGKEWICEIYDTRRLVATNLTVSRSLRLYAAAHEDLWKYSCWKVADAGRSFLSG